MYIMHCMTTVLQPMTYTDSAASTNNNIMQELNWGEMHGQNLILRSCNYFVGP